MLVLSGGVSAGVLDLVPGVLTELGVEQVFHKVDLKPGKPLWFGVRRRKPWAADARIRPAWKSRQQPRLLRTLRATGAGAAGGSKR